MPCGLMASYMPCGLQQEKVDVLQNDMSYFQLSSLRIAFCNIPPKIFPLTVSQSSERTQELLKNRLAWVRRIFFIFYFSVSPVFWVFVGEGFLVCLDGVDHTSLHQDKWDYSAYCWTRTFLYVHLNLQGIFRSQKTILSSTTGSLWARISQNLPCDRRLWQNLLHRQVHKK